MIRRKTIKIFTILDLQSWEGGPDQHSWAPLACVDQSKAVLYILQNLKTYACAQNKNTGCNRIETWCNKNRLYKLKTSGKNYVPMRAWLLSQVIELEAKKIVYEHLAAIVESLLRSSFRSLVGSPSFRKTCLVEIAMKPLTPISIVKSRGFQAVMLEISLTKGKYFDIFLTWAASIPSSAGQVSSISITFLILVDHIVISGLSAVENISGGNT